MDERIPRPLRASKDDTTPPNTAALTDPRPKVVKRDFVVAVAMECALTYSEAQSMVEAILDVIREEIIEGRSVHLKRFGRIRSAMTKQGGCIKKGKPPTAQTFLKVDHRQKEWVIEQLIKTRNGQHGIKFEDIDGYPVAQIDPDVFMRLGVFRTGGKDNVSSARARSHLARLRKSLEKRAQKVRAKLGIEDDPIERQQDAVDRDRFYQSIRRPWVGGYRTLPNRFLDGKRPEAIQRIFDKVDTGQA